jgi:endogenous inhibitor of DNA gyrase (YacG/DUF329 family)
MITVRCPICQRLLQGPRPAEWPHFPFCSKRCRLIDLGRWLNEDYRLAAEDEDEAPLQEGDTNLPS